MSGSVIFKIDGVEVTAQPGQTIIEAADEAGIYIPRLCHKPPLEPYGSCRVCTVFVNGRPCSACTQPVSLGVNVEANSERMERYRKDIVEMLFVEGNHFCMFCEKSGNCELQALAYRLGIPAVRFPFLWPQREIDASHPDIMLDHNRCILCARCIRASKELDGKPLFEFVGRGVHKRIAVDSEVGLGGTNAERTDQFVDICPVGAILKKREGFTIPIGKRTYDHKPIGTEIESGPPTE